MIYQHQKIKKESNTRYRTWKKGKNWCYSFSVLAVLTGGAVMLSGTASADVSTVVVAETEESTIRETPAVEEAPPALEVLPAEASVTDEIPADDTAAAPAEETAADSAISVEPEAAGEISEPIQETAQETPASSLDTAESQAAEEIPDASTGIETVSQAATFAAAAEPAAEPITADAVDSDVSLLKGQTNQAQPETEELESDTPRRLGVEGSFTANTSDLVAGNTIVIAKITQESTEPSGLLVPFEADGAAVTLRDEENNIVGTIRYNEALKAIILTVTNTVTATGNTQYYEFSGPWVMVINYQTPASITQKMPFSNSLSISGNPEKTYTFNFVKVTTKDATTIRDDSAVLTSSAKQVDYDTILYHEDIPTSTALQELQDNKGQSVTGTLLENKDVMQSYRISGDALNGKISSNIFLNIYYVSALTGKIQSPSDDNAAYSSAMTGLRIQLTPVNAGDGLSLSELQAKAAATGIYYSYQNDGSYLVVDYISSEDTVLTDEEITAAVRKNPLAGTSSDPDADLQATLEYYHGALKNRASIVMFSDHFGFSDQYSANTTTVERLNDDGSLIGQPKVNTSVPNSVAAAGQTTIKVHYVDEDGKTLADTDTSFGFPEGNSVGAPVDSNYGTKPKDIPGYTYIQYETTAGLVASGDGSISAPYPASGQTDITYIYKANTQKVIYNVIDDTAGKNVETNVAFDSGGTSANLNKEQSDLQAIADDYIPDGYEVVSVDTLPIAFDDDDAVNQVVNIHLKHGTSSAEETETVNETIHYVYESDNSKAADDYTDSVTFTRTATTDQVTKEITYTAWIAEDGDSSFDEVTSPSLKGYTVDRESVPEVTGLDGDSADIIETVVYTANAQKIVYNVIDDTTGETIEDTVDFDDGVTNGPLNKTQDDLQAIADGYIPDGYEIVSVDTLPTAFDDDDAVNQVVNIHLKHIMEETTETEEVNETIHYVYEDGSEAASDHTDKVSFTRTVTTDKVTGEITYGDWTSDDTSFDEVTSPLIDGYTADKLSIDEITDLTAESEDSEVTVTYVKDEDEKTPPDDDSKKDEPDAPIDDSKDEDEDTPVDEPKTPSPAPISFPAAPMAEAKVTKAALPSTGDENSSFLTLAGEVAVLSAGVFLLGAANRLKRKKH